MAIVSMDVPSDGSQFLQADDSRNKTGTVAASLPDIDPRVRAIYSIPTDLFILEASRALTQFHGIASELLSNLHQTEGNMRELCEDFPRTQTQFTALLPTVAIVVGRLVGEDLDGSAKMSLNSASKAFAAFERASTGQEFVSEEGLRECQIGVDFLSVGLTMMQG